MIQTAVSWVYWELPSDVRVKFKELFDRAIDIEREQIIHSHMEGHHYYGINTDDHVRKLAKKFYLENYDYEQDS